MPAIGAKPRLLSTRQAADLLNVNRRTVLNWIEADKVPYVKLPGGDFRIPLAGLLASLQGTYRLDKEIRELDARYSELDDETVHAALQDD
jgi:excisionase family DNA binding protein